MSKVKINSKKYFFHLRKFCLIQDLFYKTLNQKFDENKKKL